MAFMLIPGHSKVTEIDQDVTEVPDGVNLVVNVAKEVRTVKLAGLPLASRLASVAIRNKGAEMILQSDDFEDSEYRLEAGCYVVLGCRSKWQVLAHGVAGVEVKPMIEVAKNESVKVETTGTVKVENVKAENVKVETTDAVKAETTGAVKVENVKAETTGAVKPNLAASAKSILHEPPKTPDHKKQVAMTSVKVLKGKDRK